MPYIVKIAGVGPWVQGDIIEDADWDAYPWREKSIRKGSVVRLTAAELRELGHPAADAERLAELAAQIPPLEAEHAALGGAAPPEPVIRPGSKGGRPLKYQDSGEFMKHIELVVRTYYYIRHQRPSKAVLAYALNIGEPTLYAAMERFNITEDTLQQMIEDLAKTSGNLAIS